MYDPEDQLFFAGLMVDYAPHFGHRLRTAGDELCTLDLATSKVKWLQAPQQAAGDAAVPTKQPTAASMCVPLL